MTRLLGASEKRGHELHHAGVKGVGHVALRAVRAPVPAAGRRHPQELAAVRQSLLRGAGGEGVGAGCRQHRWLQPQVVLKHALTCIASSVFRFDAVLADLSSGWSSMCFCRCGGARGAAQTDKGTMESPQHHFAAALLLTTHLGVHAKEVSAQRKRNANGIAHNPVSRDESNVFGQARKSTLQEERHDRWVRLRLMVRQEYHVVTWKRRTRKDICKTSAQEQIFVRREASKPRPSACKLTLRDPRLHITPPLDVTHPGDLIVHQSTARRSENA